MERILRLASSCRLPLTAGRVGAKTASRIAAMVLRVGSVPEMEQCAKRYKHERASADSTHAVLHRTPRSGKNDSLVGGNPGPIQPFPVRPRLERRRRIPLLGCLASGRAVYAGSTPQSSPTTTLVAA